MELTARYDEALVYASDLHRQQTRKGTSIPYLSHLMAVSGLVLEAGGDEDLAIAGLLHDSLEDQGDKTSVAELTRRFGSRVAEVVLACSHSEYGGEEPTDPAEKWRWRRDHYLAQLTDAPTDVLMVSRADKLHNARSIAADLHQIGPALWDRFRVGREGQLWYYSRLSAIFSARLPGGQSDLLALTVAELQLRTQAESTHAAALPAA